MPLRRTGHDAFIWELEENLSLEQLIMTVMFRNLSAFNEGHCSHIEDRAFLFTAI